MRPGRTRGAPATLLASGPVMDGIGTLGSTLIRSSLTMEFSSTRSVGASTLLGSRLALRILDTDTAGTATADTVGTAMAETATVGSALLDTSGRVTVQPTPPLVAPPGPLDTRITFVALASLASAAAGVSAAEGSTEAWVVVADSTEVAADSMAAGAADTARTTMSRLFERHTESIPEGCADSVSRAGFCDGFQSYTG